MEIIFKTLALTVICLLFVIAMRILLNYILDYLKDRKESDVIKRRFQDK